MQKGKMLSKPSLPPANTAVATRYFIKARPRDTEVSVPNTVVITNSGARKKGIVRQLLELLQL